MQKTTATCTAVACKTGGFTMDVKEKALLAHEQWKGKLDIRTKCPITNAEELSIAYTPGVAEPCLKIRDDVELSYKYTGRGNLVAVVSSGREGAGKIMLSLHVEVSGDGNMIQRWAKLMAGINSATTSRG